MKLRTRKRRTLPRDVIIEDDGNFGEVKGTKSEIQSILNSLVAQTGKIDPTLMGILQEIINELETLGIEIYGPPEVPGKITPPIVEPALLPISFTYQFTELNVILNWVPPNAEFTFYELRRGTNWDTAVKVLFTNNMTAVLEPHLVGTYTYLIKAINTAGQYTDTFLALTFSIPPISSFQLVADVVANSFTLSWGIPISTFRIDYYIVKRDGVEVTRTPGNFYARAEQVAGTYIFSVIAVDVAGNRSPEVQTPVTTTGLTDYIFFSRLDWTLNGTVINGKKESNRIFYCIINETYEQHFQSRGWNSPQDQVNAGYLPWSSPYALNGSYEELFDFGVVISNIVVNIGYSYRLVSGNFIIGLETLYSNDGVNWSDPQTSPSFYVLSARFFKVKLIFTAANALSLLELSNLFVALNVKRENDGGESVGYATDPLGTAVLFNKDFIDVEGITVTPISDTSTFATHTFDDIRFPESFLVKIFDNAGVRVTRGFRWNARGVV